MLPTSQKMMFSKFVITECSFSVNINVSNVPVSTGSSSKQAFTIIYIYIFTSHCYVVTRCYSTDQLKG